MPVRIRRSARPKLFGWQLAPESQVCQAQLMTRTIWSNGTVLDGTGAAPSVADIAIEGDRIVEIGSDLDGDESIDCTGRLVTLV